MYVQIPETDYPSQPEASQSPAGEDPTIPSGQQKSWHNRIWIFTDSFFLSELPGFRREMPIVDNLSESEHEFRQLRQRTGSPSIFGVVEKLTTAEVKPKMELKAQALNSNASH